MCNVPEAQRSGPAGLQRQDRVWGSRFPRRYPTGGARDMHPPPCHHPLSSGLSTEASQEPGRGQGACGAETLPRPTVSSSPPTSQTGKLRPREESHLAG